jgi:hypothetical protein
MGGAVKGRWGGGAREEGALVLADEADGLDDGALREAAAGMSPGDDNEGDAASDWADYEPRDLLVVKVGGELAVNGFDCVAEKDLPGEGSDL